MTDLFSRAPPQRQHVASATCESAGCAPVEAPEARETSSNVKPLSQLDQLRAIARSLLPTHLQGVTLDAAAFQDMLTHRRCAFCARWPAPFGFHQSARAGAPGFSTCLGHREDGLAVR